MKNEIFVSVDIEADGPCPGVNSMLSLGAAAFVRTSLEPIATFEVNIHQLDGGKADPDTMKWWSEQDPKVWEHIRKDLKTPEEAMRAFDAWTKRLPGTPILVSYPTWDITWVSWYFGTFVGKNPYGISALDLKSMAFGMGRNRPFKSVSKKNMPKRWFKGTPPHNHTALQDAIGQGVMLVNMLSDDNDY